MNGKFDGIRVGFCVCGSYCTLSNVFEMAERLKNAGCELVPVMSFNAASISTRFGRAEDNVARITELCGRKPIMTIEDAEPIGPKNMTDIMLVANCTGNTLAKLACSITDSPVTMAVKSHLRNIKPVLLSIATNDALAGSAKNIFTLMNYKNYFFVPMRQDDSEKKPMSLMSDFSLVEDAIVTAMKGRQLQPVML